MVLLLIVSFVLLVFGLLSYIRLNRIKRNGILTKGVILEIEYNKKTVDENRYNVEYYTLKYLSIDNQEIIAKTNFALSSRRLSVGDELPVIYDKDNPRVPIVFFETQKLFYLFFILISCVALVFFLVFFLLKVETYDNINEFFFKI